MKRYIFRTIFILLVLLITTIYLIGCKENIDDDNDTPDYIYYPDDSQFPLPTGAAWSDNITVAGEMFYFTTMPDEYEEAEFMSNSIYSSEINFHNVSKLPNYSVKNDIPIDAEEGYTRIQEMIVDEAGNIWVAERGEYYYFPDDIAENDPERWHSRIIVKSLIRVRELDNTGAEVSAFDVSNTFANIEFFNVTAFAIDSNGLFYIGSSKSIYVFDNNGNHLFTTDVDWVERLINTPDGAVASLGWAGSVRALFVIDVSQRGIGETINLPIGANRVFSGNDEFSFIFTGDVGIYAIDNITGNVILLLNWMDSNRIYDDLNNITLLSDERIFTTHRNRNSDSSVLAITIFSRVPHIERPDITVLTLATFNFHHDMWNAVVEFNNTSTTHRIEVKDYSGSNPGEITIGDDYWAGLMRLSTEIITGNAPDIIDVSRLPVNQYIARGLLLDLYPLIDADPDLNRTDFLPSILRNIEVDGGLYRIFPFFFIDTMVGNPSRIGSYPGWNIDEFVAVVNANRDLDFPFGMGFTKQELLFTLVLYNIDSFIDWHTGTVFFDSDEFISILEFANTLPDTFHWGDDITDVGLMRSGQQIIRGTSLTNFNEYLMYQALFGGELVFKGFPEENRNGNTIGPSTSFAITTNCSDVEGAWSFIRSFLMPEWQDDHYSMGFPTNQHAFDIRLQEAIEGSDRNPVSMGWEDFTVRWTPLTPEDVDLILALIDSLHGTVGRDQALFDIISEDAARYFNGQATARDAARVIQNRISLYVSEAS
ncbi:MAG: hypothetical protein LBC73_04480 [Oscillospiraceae bacterium]|jgi:ABC-type glycerol-3-phosphate transport system substrate-binding protein|nr:hypothetical protein [Oscillospiraceae bacterium]